MYETYAKLRDSRGLTDYQVAKETGLGRATFTDLKNKGHRPSTATLKKLADFFGVSIDYLMTGKDTEKRSESGTPYYFTDETAAAAQKLYESKELRMLFDAAQGARPQDLEMAAEMLRRFKETNRDG